MAWKGPDIRLSDVWNEGIVRDGTFRFTDFAHGTLERSLCLAGSEKYITIANNNPAISCVVTLPPFADAFRDTLGVIVSNDASETFYTIHNSLFRAGKLSPVLEPAIDPSACIHPTAFVEEGCRVEAEVFVDAGAIVRKGTHLGEGVFIGSGALVGVEGHFYKRFKGILVRIEHAGGVRIGDGSQVLAGAIIQRAMHPDWTRIGHQTVLGPGVQLAHGVQVGDDCILAGGTQVAGYTKIGNSVWIGPSCAIGNMIEIGDEARIELGSVVAKSVSPRERITGWYAATHLRSLRAQARVLSQ